MIAKLKKKKSTVDLADSYYVDHRQPGRPQRGLRRTLPGLRLAGEPQHAGPDRGLGRDHDVDESALTAKDLPAIGAIYANALAVEHRARRSRVPKIVTLPVRQGRAHRWHDPPPGAARTGSSCYLIPHGKKLYMLAFQIEAPQLAARDALHLDRAELQVHRSWRVTERRVHESPTRPGGTLSGAGGVSELIVARARSSEEERRPSKPMVGGSNPPGASIRGAPPVPNRRC